jgi:serine protease inhibitor
VLINAIYFKGLWKEPFQKGLTKPGPFYLDETMRSVVVPFINKQTCFNYIDSNELQAEVVELKYGVFLTSNTLLSHMISVLPRQNLSLLLYSQ